MPAEPRRAAAGRRLVRAAAPTPPSARSRCTACARARRSSASRSASSASASSASSRRRSCSRPAARVVGIDLDPRRRRARPRSRARGVRSRATPGSRRACELTTGGLRARRGAHLCASSRSPDPLAARGELARDRGRIVVVGDVPIEVDRATAVREGARAAPVALVRARPLRPSSTRSAAATCPPATCAGPSSGTCRRSSTCSRAGASTPRELTTHRFPVDDARRGVRAAHRQRRRRAPVRRRARVRPARGRAAAAVAPSPRAASRAARVGVALIGAGTFARGDAASRAREAGGAPRRRRERERPHRGRRRGRLGFERAAARLDELLDDDDDRRRRDRDAARSHMPSSRRAALRAGKAVFVEKPLALTDEQLARGRGRARRRSRC